MNRKEALVNIKSAHEKYAAWWLPFDLACNSCLAAMSCHRFCERLLTETTFWDKWADGFTRRHVLEYILMHYIGQIDLNHNVNQIS